MFDPDAILDLLRHADRLEALPRTGWVVSRVANPESVAAHAYGVVLTTLTLCDAIRARPEPPPLDVGRALSIATLHDIAESLITDIPSPVKRRIGAKAVLDAEREAARELLLPLSPRYVELWEEYADGQTLEARVVKAADRLQMMIKALQYERVGRGDLTRFWARAYNLNDYGLPEARALFERLLQHRADRSWPYEDL